MTIAVISKTEDPMAWAIKYLVAASVERAPFLTMTIGMKERRLISSPTQTRSQLLEDTDTIVEVSNNRKNRVPEGLIWSI